ncbi:60S ribosomal protein L10A [Moesziomyces antarcticus T-34]|uniref:60S ribosomal protein L10A n=1 Tax=Pseudozyma antarctica (strain T-34) TaxID=1151754 RepID=M9MAN9_PSEA3|nr:60S ribosomal protein L10A [Moesziomyces antarcticus T-34]
MTPSTLSISSTWIRILPPIHPIPSFAGHSSRSSALAYLDIATGHRPPYSDCAFHPACVFIRSTWQHQPRIAPWSVLQQIMTATAASPASAPGLLAHRYSNPPLSTPRSSDSLQINTSFGSAAPRMALSMSSPASSASASSTTTPMASGSATSHDEQRTDTFGGAVKYACASCIRGHRTSSCSHKDGSKGPLYPIRSKGRPPTQCEVCRQKRKESGRHVRCDCSGKKTSAPTVQTTPTASLSSKRSSPTPTKPRTAGSTCCGEADCHQHEGRAPKKARTTGDGPSLPHAPVSPKHTTTRRPSLDHRTASSRSRSPPQAEGDIVLAPIRPARAQHSWSLPSIHAAHDPDDAVDEEVAPRRSSTLSLSNLMNPRAAETTTSSCCSGQPPAESSAPSIELLLRAVDMSTEFVPPPCACSDACRPKQVPGCDDCAACDLGLERPSGIGAVDSWMAQTRSTDDWAARPRASSLETRAADKSAVEGGRRSSQPMQLQSAHEKAPQMLHGGLLTSLARADDKDEEVRAELVLVHPECDACLHVVRTRGVGVLTPAPPSTASP